MVETSNAAWNILQKSYKGEERVRQVRLQSLRADFENLSVDESKSISSFFDRLQCIINQMQVNGEKIDNQRIVENILLNMVSKFDHVTTPVEQAHDLSKMTIEMLLGILTSHEQRLNQQAKKLAYRACFTK